jgi:hypothetical protein
MKANLQAFEKHGGWHLYAVIQKSGFVARQVAMSH